MRNFGEGDAGYRWVYVRVRGEALRRTREQTRAEIQYQVTKLADCFGITRECSRPALGSAISLLGATDAPSPLLVYNLVWGMIA